MLILFVFLQQAEVYVCKNQEANIEAKQCNNIEPNIEVWKSQSVQVLVANQTIISTKWKIV